MNLSALFLFFCLVLQPPTKEHLWISSWVFFKRKLEWPVRVWWVIIEFKFALLFSYTGCKLMLERVRLKMLGLKAIQVLEQTCSLAAKPMGWQFSRFAPTETSSLNFNEKYWKHNLKIFSWNYWSPKDQTQASSSTEYKNVAITDGTRQ